MSDVLSRVKDSEGETGEEISGAQKPGYWTQTEPRAILRKFGAMMHFSDCHLFADVICWLFCLFLYFCLLYRFDGRM